MASNEIETDIEEQARFLTTCSICMDQFSSPKVLQCQHTFCLECIKSCYESVNRTRIVATSNFPCPTCRKICFVPCGGINKLADDFRIGQILDLLTAIDSSQQKTNATNFTFGHCSICRFQKREKAASSFCLQCEKAFCNECLSHHAKANIFQEHVIINDENKKEEEENDEETMDRNNGKCSEHKGALKYMCEDCSVWLCTVCLFEGHNAHSIKEKSQYLEHLNTTLELLCHQFITRLNKNASMVDTLNSLREQQLTSCNNCETEIKSASKRAIEEIEKLQTQLLSNIKTNQEAFASETEQIFQSLQSNSTDIDKKIQRLDSLKSEIPSNENLKEISDFDKEIHTNKPNSFKPFAQEIFKFKTSIDIILGNLEKSKKMIDLQKLCNKKEMEAEKASLQSSSSSSLPSSSSFQPSSSSLHPQPSSSSLQSLSSTNKENKSKRSVLVFPSAQSKIPLQINNKHNNNLNTHNNKHNNNLNTQGDRMFGRKKQAESSDKLIQGLGRRLSCKLTNRSSLSTARKLNWTATGFQQCRDCCFLQLNGSWLVAACDLKAASISDRIKLFDLKGNQQQKLNTQQVFEPWGMLFNQEKNSFIITSPTNRSIKMLPLDSTGKCSRIITMSQSMNDKPTGIAMTSSGSYIVSDTGSRTNRLAIYQPSTNLLERKKEFGTKGHGNDEIALCSYVATDHNDRIIVSDAEAKEVKILSRSGHQLLKFSCSCSFDGSKEMQPQGVAVDDCGNILVADQAINGVGMFNPEGVLIGHVATTKGIPWGVAYLEMKKMLAVATSEGLEVFELGGVVGEGVEVVF